MSGTPPAKRTHRQLRVWFGEEAITFTVTLSDDTARMSVGGSLHRAAKPVRVEWPLYQGYFHSLQDLRDELGIGGVFERLHPQLHPALLDMVDELRGQP